MDNVGKLAEALLHIDGLAYHDDDIYEDKEIALSASEKITKSLTASGLTVVAVEELERLRAGDEWQTIESLPEDYKKHRTPFLAFIRHNTGGAQSQSVARYPVAYKGGLNRYLWWNVESGVSCPVVETHDSVDECWIIEKWRPLPTPKDNTQ